MNKNIQTVRGVCIFAVIMIHTCKNIYPNIFFKPLFTFPVCVFFFLSGYLTKDITNINSFYKKRLLKVLPPYIFWSIIYTIMSKGTMIAVIHNILTAGATAHLYYLVVYAEFVIITPLLLKISKGNLRYAPLLLQPIAIFLFKYLPIILSINIPSFLISENGFLWIAYYYIGILLTKTDYDKRHLYFIGFISIVLQEAEVLFWYKNNIMGLASTQIRITTMITNIIICFIVVKYITASQKRSFWAVIGDNSFGIYCCHMLILAVMIHFGFGNLPFPIYANIILILSFVLTGVASKLLPNYVKKIIGFV